MEVDICGPCKFRNESTKAAKYCVTCQEPQCKTCAEIHGSSKATRNHLLLIITDLNNASKTQEDLNKFQNCKDHPEKRLDFFCVEHDNLMCSTCLLNIQKLGCKTIVDIETAGKQVVTEKFNEQLARDLESVEANCKAEEINIQSLMDGIHQERHELQKRIEVIKKKLITQFDKCQKDILDEVDKNVKTQVAELTGRQTVLKEDLRTAKENKDILQTVISNNSTADVFRCTLSIMQQLSKFEISKGSATTDMFTHLVKVSPAFDTLIESMDIHPIMQCKAVSVAKPYTLNVNMKTDRDSFLKIAKQVALIRDSDISNDYTYSSADAEMEDLETKPDGKRLNENSKTYADFQGQSAKATLPPIATINNVSHMSDAIVLTPDCKQLQISGIVTLTDGSYVLSDSRRPRLVRVKEDLTYKDTADLSHPPGHMTVLNERFLVVCLPTGKRFAFLSVSSEFKWMRNFKTTHTPKGVHALDASRLLVSMMSDVDGQWYLLVLTTDEAILRDIGKTRSVLDASLIASLKLTPTSPTCYLQCCKVSNALYCFDVNGKEVFKYSVMSPKWLYVDSAGKIFVLDSCGLLHILTNNGMLLQTVNVPTEANGVTSSKKKDTLLITRQCSAAIGVLIISR